jgi:hypothetical protein
VLKAGILMVHSAQALGVGNVMVNGGTLNADPRQINVGGNYTQTAGGTLQLQVAGANPGQYDYLNVGGNATLGGTLQLISLGFQPKAGNQLTLITSGGAVSGRFGQFIDPFATGPGFNTVLHSGVRRDALPTSKAGRHLGKVSKASRLTLSDWKLEERKTAYLLHSGVRRAALPTSKAGRHLGKVSKASRLTLSDWKLEERKTAYLLHSGVRRDALLTSEAGRH